MQFTTTEYAPLDPSGVEPLSTGPASSFAPQEDLPRPDAKAAQAPEDETEDVPLPEFDERCKEEFEGLLFVGALTARFRWMGHDFVMKTLNVDELLAVALLHKKFMGTLGDGKAYETAMIAASVVSIDGKALPVQTFGDEAPLENKFSYVAQYFPNVIDQLFGRYLELEVTVDRVIDSMGKVTG